MSIGSEMGQTRGGWFSEVASASPCSKMDRSIDGSSPRSIIGSTVPPSPKRSRSSKCRSFHACSCALRHRWGQGLLSSSRACRAAAGSSSVAECKLQVPDDARTYLPMDRPYLAVRTHSTGQVSPGNGVKLAGQNKGASTAKDEGRDMFSPPACGSWVGLGCRILQAPTLLKTTNPGHFTP